MQRHKDRGCDPLHRKHWDMHTQERWKIWAPQCIQSDLYMFMIVYESYIDA